MSYFFILVHDIVEFLNDMTGAKQSNNQSHNQSIKNLSVLILTIFEIPFEHVERVISAVEHACSGQEFREGTSARAAWTPSLEDKHMSLLKL